MRMVLMVTCLFLSLASFATASELTFRSLKLNSQGDFILRFNEAGKFRKLTDTDGMATLATFYFILTQDAHEAIYSGKKKWEDLKDTPVQNWDTTASTIQSALAKLKSYLEPFADQYPHIKPELLDAGDLLQKTRVYYGISLTSQVPTYSDLNQLGIFISKYASNHEYDSFRFTTRPGQTRGYFGGNDFINLVRGKNYLALVLSSRSLILPQPPNRYSPGKYINASFKTESFVGYESETRSVLSDTESCVIHSLNPMMGFGWTPKMSFHSPSTDEAIVLAEQDQPQSKKTAIFIRSNGRFVQLDVGNIVEDSLTGHSSVRHAGGYEVGWFHNPDRPSAYFLNPEETRAFALDLTNHPDSSRELTPSDPDYRGDEKHEVQENREVQEDKKEDDWEIL